jgi:hypothetical protein
MSAQTEPRSSTDERPAPDFDVLIVGAGFGGLQPDAGVEVEGLVSAELVQQVGRDLDGGVA